MAMRRMFSPQIVESDAFLDMPLTAQALYFHLGMNADDDGFISPRKIIRMLGAAEDDIKILLGKRFLLPCENGVVVIKHWNRNNLIRKDFYKPTEYIEQKAKLHVKENGIYTDDPEQGTLIVEPQKRPTDILLTEQQQPVNVGKVRLGKVSKGNNKEIVLCEFYGELKNVELTPEQYVALGEKIGVEARDDIIDQLSTYIPNKKGKPYKDHYAAVLSWARKKKGELAARHKTFSVIG